MQVLGSILIFMCFEKMLKTAYRNYTPSILPVQCTEIVKPLCFFFVVSVIGFKGNFVQEHKLNLYMSFRPVLGFDETIYVCILFVSLT
jgi:hypothetical protein